jgi:hypothetical protein
MTDKVAIDLALNDIDTDNRKRIIQVIKSSYITLEIYQRRPKPDSPVHAGSDYRILIAPGSAVKLVNVIWKIFQHLKASRPKKGEIAIHVVGSTTPVIVVNTYEGKHIALVNEVAHQVQSQSREEFRVACAELQSSAIWENR